MPVMPVILAGMGCRGSTSCENVATWRPPSMRTAPISVILVKPGRAAGGLEVDDREGDVREVAPRGRATRSRPTWKGPSHAKRSSSRTMSATSAAHELGGTVGDREEAGPDLAVVEGLASLLEKSEQLVDSRER